MNYQKIYNQIIEKRKCQILVKSKLDVGSVECHHIIPLCLNGTNHKNNLVMLTPREHYICHLLLWKMHPKSLGLNFALLSMANNSNNTNKRLFRYCSKLYAVAKKQHAVNMQKYYENNSGTIKGKILVFNQKTQSIEYWNKSIEYPCYIMQIKVIWIHNLVLHKEKQIPDFFDIPKDWKKGRLKNRSASHTGLMMISNPKTFEVRYVEKGTDIPIGWKKGKSRKIPHENQRKYHTKCKEKYEQKAAEMFQCFVSCNLSFVELSKKYPEIKNYKSCNYIIQMFARNIPNIDIRSKINEIKSQLKKNGIAAFDGYWHNPTKGGSKNTKTQHKIKYTMIGMH